MHAVPAHPRRRRRRRGFTLLEVLIALVIVVMIGAGLYVSLRVAFQSKLSAERVVEPPRTAAVALDLIGQDLQGSVAPTGLVWATSFEGVTGADDRGRPGDDLQFFSVADSPLHPSANGDIKSVELTVQTAPNGQDHLLVRKVVRNLLTQSTTPNPDVEVICRGVGGFHLRYYNGDAWADTWDSTQQDNTLPAAVEVTLTLDRDGGPVAEPDGGRAFRYTRVFPMPCSTAAQDSAVNPNAAEGL